MGGGFMGSPNPLVAEMIHDAALPGIMQISQSKMEAAQFSSGRIPQSFIFAEMFSIIKRNNIHFHLLTENFRNFKFSKYPYQ